MEGVRNIDAQEMNAIEPAGGGFLGCRSKSRAPGSRVFALISLVFASTRLLEMDFYLFIFEYFW